MVTSAEDPQSQNGLDDLFDRVNQLLGSTPPRSDETDGDYRKEAQQHSHVVPGQPFTPRQPQSIRESGISAALIERLIMKYLYQVGLATSRGIAAQMKLPFKVIEPILKQLRSDKQIDLAGTTNTGDSDYMVTDAGRDRGKRYHEECTYFGAAPVSLQDYVSSVSAQSIAGQIVTADDLNKAFDGLIINQDMLDRLGPAVNSGRGMFLFGEPGNGKTSIAERVTDAFGTSIWLPRALYIEGEMIRLYDPGIHE
ncbi:MAG: AAA family ATPase, partial [Fuerstiella sp.]|nr:AAA family ATPase [Fuerstiella sp.]